MEIRDYFISIFFFLYRLHTLIPKGLVEFEDATPSFLLAKLIKESKRKCSLFESHLKIDPEGIDEVNGKPGKKIDNK